MDTQNQSLLDYVPTKLFKRFKKIGLTQINTPFQQAGHTALQMFKKGQKIDGESSQKFYQLMVEAISYWGTSPNFAQNRQGQ